MSHRTNQHRIVVLGAGYTGLSGAANRPLMTNESLTD